MINPLERLKTLINSSTPIIVLETLEEKRAISMVRMVCGQLHLPLFEWSIANGLVRSGSSGPLNAPPQTMAHPIGLSEQAPALIANTREPAQVLAHLETMSIDTVVILKDFHRHMDDPIVVRRLRDVGQKFCCPRRTLVLTGPSIEVPPELASLVEYVELPLPDAARLLQIVDDTFERLCWQRTLKRTLDSAGEHTLANNLRGLTEEEAERSLSQAVLVRGALCPEVVTDVLDEKKSLLRHSGMLEFIDVSDNFGSIGGLENLKRWLEQRRGAWEQPARDFGLEPPRGVIIMGVQGCGKSLCARAIAGEWKLPLVKCDTAALFDKYVGGTEKHIKRLFQVCEELAPAVLWIDEMEKVFAGSEPGSASSDAGVSARLLGSFLSWMQDRTAPVFIVATSNNVTALPPELIRKGRFDELFFVDLPNTSERRAILALHLSRHKQNPAAFDLDKLAAATEGYSGAELDAAVQTAMYASFSTKKPVNTEAVLQALHCTVPLSATRAEEIQALRQWAQHRAVPASLPESEHGDGR
jgi:ATP-dependent 26S proteasome regulatory subunit